MKMLREFGSQTCVYVSGVSSTSKQNKIASGTTPIQDFKFDVRSDRNELLRRVTCTLERILGRARKREGKE